jgi:NADH dehydrogenase [ubiquinone] 1 alpha subcomplex assembly factor 1
MVLFCENTAMASEDSASTSSMNESVQQITETNTMELSPIFEFDKKSEPWQVINDGVMGGLSSSRFSLMEGGACFEGSVSLENNGGFASVRSEPQNHDLSPFQGILLRARGDGKRYVFRLRNSGSFDGVSYQAHFETVSDEWITIRLPFESFKPVFRGRLVQNAEPLDLKSIKSFGFLISDKQAGVFRIDISWD